MMMANSPLIVKRYHVTCNGKCKYSGNGKLLLPRTDLVQVFTCDIVIVFLGAASRVRASTG